VSALSHQTPTFGNLPGTEGGDFIFNLKHETEFLNGDSPQLDDEAIKANAELETLRSQNEELRKQLATVQAQLKQGPPPASTPLPSSESGSTPATTSAAATSGTTPAPAADPAAAANDEGMRLYKEKRYAEAAAKFTGASNLQPASALYANNAGFAFFRMGEYDEAVKWYLQTVALDPKRAVAYLNLGDAYLNLQKKSEAKDAYEKFLALSPNSKSAPDVLDRMKLLP
jgi:tetratricopeptide (TPR) repeat protein